MNGDRVAAARRAALGGGGGTPAPRRVGAWARTLAVGDPQAPFDTFLGILDRHGALADDGWLAPDVELISMGDHFDWGDKRARSTAAADGELLLRWLARHSPAQVHILIGNHDLARVGELWDLSDERFAAALHDADACTDQPPEREAAFKRDWPHFFSAEMVARDFSTFRVSQRELVEELLATRRFLAAHAHHGALFLHAGVTRYELEQLKVPEGSSPAAIAAALNRALYDANASRGQRPLVMPGLHQPGTGAFEGRGMFYHRPTLGEGAHAHRLEGERPLRRFHPRDLPSGLTQVVGHVRDGKCHEELAAWSRVSTARDGPVRHLVVEGGQGRYAHGAPGTTTRDAAVMIFVDNGMGKIEQPAEYRVLDATTRVEAAPLR